jgi:hypothetical protein
MVELAARAAAGRRTGPAPAKGEKATVVVVSRPLEDPTDLPPSRVLRQPDIVLIRPLGPQDAQVGIQEVGGVHLKLLGAAELWGLCGAGERLIEVDDRKGKRAVEHDQLVWRSGCELELKAKHDRSKHGRCGFVVDLGPDVRKVAWLLPEPLL